MKIACFETKQGEKEGLESLRKEHDLVFWEEPLDADNAGDAADAEVLSVFIYSKADSVALKQFKNLRLIATRSTGVDHIDTEYCGAHGITIANVPTYGSSTVAEHTFALLLALSHRIVDAVQRTRAGNFSQESLRGFDLQGKTLGVIGTGAIGENVVRIGKGFGMEVVAFDVKEKEDLARHLGFQYLELNEILRRSDVITLHVPLNGATRNMLSRDQFGMMKRGVVILNTARGALIDIEALCEALADGRVAAAGLDVLPEEPAIREEAELLCTDFRKQHDMSSLLAHHVLLRQPNVIVTPHSAFNTREAVQSILDTTVCNITSFARGKPRNVVNPE